MDQFAERIEQVRLFAEQFQSGESFAHAVPAALVFLVAGIGLSVLGAKLARIGLTTGFVAMGAFAGHAFAGVAGVPSPLCMVAGAVMLGTIGHLTHRLWVGVAVAVVASSLVLGAFGYQRLLPELEPFRQSQLQMMEASTGFSIPTPDEQERNLAGTMRENITAFWDYVVGRDAGIQRRAQVLGLSAMLTGLFLGVVAVRWALILATSLIGTALVTSGVATLLASFFPGSYQSFLAHPQVGGMAVGIFLMTSFALQVALTRKSPSTDGGGRSAS